MRRSAPHWQRESGAHILVVPTKSQLSAVSLFLLAMYFVTKPFYFWDSGLPQPADLILLLLVISQASAWATGRTPKLMRLSPFPIMVMLFAYYVTLVNTTAALFVGDASIARTSLFYAFNAVVAVMVYGMVMLGQRKVVRVIFTAATLSLVVQFLLVALDGGLSGSTGRVSASFNNPNQVAAYAVLIFVIILATAEHRALDAWITASALVMSGLLIMASLSRAGMMVMPLLLVAYFLYAMSDRFSLRQRISFLGVAAGFAALLVGYLSVLTTSGLWESVERRWAVQKADSTLSGRGYDRVMDHPEFWLFGGGEGAHYRFGSTIELHSGVGTLIYAYGAVGVLLFLGAVYYALKGKGLFGLLLVASPLAFGLTHQVLRNTLLWVLLATLASLSDADAQHERASQDSATRSNDRSGTDISSSIGSRSD